VQQTANEKIKKGVVRGSERMPVGKLSKSLKILPSTYRQPTGTRNMTIGLWFSVVNLILKHVHGIFQTLSLESQYLEILKHILQ